MTETILHNFLQIIIGFSGGLAVGGGFVAFITVLGIIPRLIQLSKTEKYIKVFGASVIFGLLFGSYLSFAEIPVYHPYFFLAIVGMFHGIFNGMLAAALTEVLNVFPILTKRIGFQSYVITLLMAIVFGKVIGSLFQWVIFVRL